MLQLLEVKNGLAEFVCISLISGQDANDKKRQGRQQRQGSNVDVSLTWTNSSGRCVSQILQATPAPSLADLRRDTAPTTAAHDNEGSPKKETLPPDKGQCCGVAGTGKRHLSCMKQNGPVLDSVRYQASRLLGRWTWALLSQKQSGVALRKG